MNLKEIRLKKGYLQKEVADYAGITQQSYSAIEKGINKPSISVAKSIADCFGMRIEELFFDDKYNHKLDKTI